MILEHRIYRMKNSDVTNHRDVISFHSHVYVISTLGEPFYYYSVVECRSLKDWDAGSFTMDSSDFCELYELVE